MHSETEKTAPIVMRFLPHDLLCEAISRAPRRICSLIGKSLASMDCTLDWNGARMTPRPRPSTPPAMPAMIDCMTQFSRPACVVSRGGCHTNVRLSRIGILVGLAQQ